jgi:hypothetical protein
MNGETARRPLAPLRSLTLVRNVLLGSALVAFSGCGSKNKADEPLQTPATVEQAVRTLDLSTVPLVEGAKRPWPRRVAGLNYTVKSNTRTAFEFHRKKLLADGWKELPNTSVTDQSASATFARSGFVVSLSAFPNGQGDILVSLQNLGNIKPGQLPLPPGAKPVYVGDASAMYVVETTVPATAEAVRALLLAKGWVPYGSAGDSVYYKQNAIQITATVSSAPAQGGKTMISYSGEQLSADIPAPADAEGLRYTDQTQELSFQSAQPQAAIVALYRQALAEAKWEATLDHTVDIDDTPTMIFRNPGKDMLTLGLRARGSGDKVRVSVRYQSAAEIAELDRKLKEQAPALRAAAEAKEKAEAARVAEANKPPPKLPITLPADAQDVEETKSEIKFTVGHGKAKAAAETLRKQFRDAGWKEDLATLDAMVGALSFSKDRQSLSVHYTDTGVMPSEVSVSAMGAELERH